MGTALSADDVAAFDTTWQIQWPACRPVGHELRLAASSWVRFHSLPGSRRYPVNEDDYDELLSRHFTVLGELTAMSAAPSEDLWVITSAWSDGPEPAERDKDLVAAFPSGTWWRSIPYDPTDPDYPVWLHLYLGRAALDSAELRALLRLVAADGTGGVIVCSPSVNWLYYPYDGGADVIAPDDATRDRLRASHAEWLPRLPSGL